MAVKVISSGRLSVASLHWRRADGSHACTLLCKASFRLQPGRSPLCSKPQPPFLANRHWRDDIRSSLSQANDLVPGKRRPEVIVVGDTFAPGGVPAHAWTARLAIGGIDKRIDVYAERHWYPDGALQASAPRTRVALHWEHAAGGIGSDNPAGRPLAGVPDEHGRKPAPHFQTPGSLLNHPDDLLLPVGYGPLAPQWPARTIHLHNAASGWSHDDWAHTPIPVDVDWAYFNAAPRDQQLTSLRGDEPLTLESLIDGHDKLVTQLQPLSPYLSVERAAGRDTLALVCDTLWIDTLTATASLSWRATIALASATESFTAIFMEDAAKANAAADSGATITTTHSATIGDATMPLGDSAAAILAQPFPIAAAASENHSTAAGSSSRSLDAIRDESADAAPWRGPSERTVHFDQHPNEIAAVLANLTASPETGPAYPLAAAAATSSDGKSLREIRGEGDAVHWLGPSDQTLHASQIPNDIAAAIAGYGRGAPGPAPAAVRPPDPLQTSPAPPAVLSFSPSPSTPVNDQVEANSYGDSTEPSLIGPLATPELIAQHRADQAAPASEPSAQGSKPAPASEEAAPAEVPLPVDEYPLERCAAITAALDCRPDERAKILDQQQLETDLWQRLRAHYDDELNSAIQRGKLAVLHTHDQAYVTQIEEERGPITLDEYARLRVSAERGTRPGTMQELALPSPSLMPIERVWLRKTATDPRLPERLDDAIDAARNA